MLLMMLFTSSAGRRTLIVVTTRPAHQETAMSAHDEPTYPYFPPMADKPCEQPRMCATYDEHYCCTECGYPGNCHDY